MKKDFCIKKLTIFPQYKGTCWFNALLMATLYSQRSRKLILSKSDEWDIRIKIFKVFRHILKHKYVKSKYPERDFKFFDEVRPENILQMLYRFNKNEFMFNKYNRGFATEGYISQFYRLLGVSCMMLLKSNDTIMYDPYNHIKSVKFLKKRGFITSFELKNPSIIQSYLNNIPDVLLVRIKNGDNIIRDYISNNSTNNNNINSLENIIVYNNIEYELDSVILSNWNQTPSGHSIAGITCKNKRYVYNGWTINSIDPALKSKSGLSKIPCELMDFEWDLKKDDQFCINAKQCKLDKIFNNVPERTCFSFNKGKRILVYIKKNVNKLKSASLSKTPDYVSLDKKSPKITKNKSNVNVTQKTDCPDGKVRDPKTKRCISLATAMKRNLVAKPLSTVVNKQKTDCPDGKVRDPKTKRCISLATAMKRNLT
jgi:hypothetical protein